MRIVFFDTETTGNQAEDRLCQLAVKERPSTTLRASEVAKPIVNALYKPPVPISFESMAVHHITEKMVEGKPVFRETPEYKELKKLFESEDTIAVAHNVAFDTGMLIKEGITVRNPLCTLKLANELDEKGLLPNYRLQYLRYRLGIEIEALAHEAWGDVLVLEALFERQLAKIVEKVGNEAAALAYMQDVSSRPILIKSFGFGKHAGRVVADVAKESPDYLAWLLKEKQKNPAEEENWIYTLEYYLKPAV